MRDAEARLKSGARAAALLTEREARQGRGLCLWAVPHLPSQPRCFLFSR